MRLVVISVLSSTLFCFFGLSDCEAQLLRNWGRHNVVSPRSEIDARPLMRTTDGSSAQVAVNPVIPGQQFRFPTQDYFHGRNKWVSRILDGKMTHKYRDPGEVDSRYIGGFHQSHFSNLGIPSGDIGIRGNAYNWRTW